MKTRWIGVVLAALMFYSAPGLYGQSDQVEAKAPGTISVMGEASVELVADRVNIQIVAEHNMATAHEAYKMTTEEMAEAIALLKKRNDIEELKTTQVMLNPRVRDYQKGTKEYNARQTLSFTLTRLEKYDELMLNLIDLGINGVGQVHFINSEAEKYEEILMRQAVQDARKKAVILTSELGQEVGRAVVISDRYVSSPYPRMEAMMSYDSKSAGGPSVVPGNLEITKTVNIQFELK